MKNEDLDDPGRSRERERQDDLLESTSRRAGWLQRLWRSRWRTGRPKARDDRDRS